MRIRYILSTLLLAYSFATLPYAGALEATYYADAFEGGRTANGSRFSQAYHSAALCGVDLGSYIYVRGGGTGMVVTANDRPNCNLHSDVIDLSSSAFQVFAPLSRGRLTDIDTSFLSKNTVNFPKKTFGLNAFSPLKVLLSTPVSNTYFAGDSILIQGRNLDKKEYVMIYLQNQSDNKEYSTLIKADTNGKFIFPYTLPTTPGKYFFVLSSGNSFETSTPEEMVLVDKNTMNYPEIATDTKNLRPTLTENTTPYIALPENTWGILTLSQGGKKYKTSGTTLIPSNLSLKTGTASVLLEGFSLSTPSSLDRSLLHENMWSGSIIIDRLRDVSGKSKVNIRTKKGAFTFQFRVGLGDKIREIYYVTSPSGEVKEYRFQKKWVGEDGFLTQGSLISGSFLARESGAYRLEAVLESGYAHFNVPIYQGNVWSVVPLFSQNERITIEKDGTKVQNYVLDRINILRGNLGYKKLTLDDNLDRIAEAKSENMANNNYIGHWTPDGLDILAFANSLGIPHANTLSENVAGGNVSHMILQDGLEESGSHRHSILNPKWTKIGIGYIVKNKKAYLVQVFSE